MVVCPRCNTIVRIGEVVRVTVLGEFDRTELDGHYVHPYAEERLEHAICTPEPWEHRATKWIKRRFREWIG